MKIPILNLYYLISYASGIINPSTQKVPVGLTSDYELADLYGSLLCEGLDVLIRRGLYKTYHNRKEELIGVKGQIQFAESLNRNSFRYGKTVCNFDELTIDNTANQILKAAVYRLMRLSSLDKKISSHLAVIWNKLSLVSEINLSPAVFKKVIVNRNMIRYRFLLFIAWLISDQSSITEDGETVNFLDIERDEGRLAMLFEAFVRNFYRREIQNYTISHRKLKWSYESEIPDNFIPTMETDISLESEEHIIIIDTKYYAKALVENRYDSYKARSGHMYQMFAYMHHYPNSQQKPITGILLYPEVDFPLYRRLKSTTKDNNYLEFRTINLTNKWDKIRTDLLEIVGDR